MLAKVDGKSIGRNHYGGARRTGNGDIVALHVDEPPLLQEDVCLVEVVDVHSDGCHALGYRRINDVHVVTALVAHPDQGDIGVVDVLFVMTLLKAEFLEKGDDFACVLGQNSRIKGRNLHNIPP